MTQTEQLISCGNCGRPGREADATEAGWRGFIDHVGNIELVCALCTHRKLHALSGTHPGRA